MESFQLKGDTGFINMNLDKMFGFPDRTSHFGGYEVGVIVESKSSNYYVKGPMFTTTGEIFNFYQELKIAQESLKGVVHYRNYDHNLDLQIIYTQQGHTTIRGKFREKSWEDNILEFEITGDQTYMQSTLLQLQRLTDKYGDNQGLRELN